MPLLDTVCSRVQSQYLLKFLADPQATKPGTTMPNVLAGLSEVERRNVVDSLVHFLATTGHVVRANPSRHAVNRGEALFHSIGCVACHDPRIRLPHSPYRHPFRLARRRENTRCRGWRSFCSTRWRYVQADVCRIST